MKQMIFRRIFAVAMVVFAVCFSVTMWVVYNNYADQTQERLQRDLVYLSTAVEQDGEEYLNHLPRTSDQRITWIDQDGIVLFDSQVDSGALENHNQREEVQEARASGMGQSIRFSKTLDTKTTNYAILQQDGKVLRVSTTEETLLMLILSMWLPLLLILLLAVGLSLFLAGRVAQVVVRPINGIDLEHPAEDKIYPELRPLAQRIHAQNKQIHHQMELLEQEHQRQDRLRREFTANVSHELKTPLTSISGYAEIMKEGIARPEDVTRFSGKIYDEAQRLQKLVGDIIYLSQVEEPGVMASRETVRLYPLCEQAIARCKLQAEQHDITMTLTGTDETVVGSRELLGQMVSNLCENAVKYNRDGGSVRVTLNRVGDRVCLSVADTGIGIPEADQQRVFERFYRVDKSHSRAIGGTGLGLSIVKHGAAFHNAQIQMESQPGQGTEIRLLFPDKGAQATGKD